MSSVTFECIQCGNWFELTDSEKRRQILRQFIAVHPQSTLADVVEVRMEEGFDPPLRCPDCRRHKNKSDDGHRKHPNRKRDYRIKYGAKTADSLYG